MINKPTKIEIYIIVVTLVLSVMTIGGFWLVNNYNFSNLTMSINLSLSDKKEAAITKDSSDLGEDDSNDSAEKQTENQADAQPVSTNTGLTKLLAPVELNALILGDSVAEGNGASNPEETSWYANVAKDLHATYPGNINWNFIAGKKYTVDTILSQLSTLPIQSDVYILCTGRNDSYALGIEDFKIKFQELITTLQLKTPDADIVLLVEPPVQDVNVNNQYFPYRQVILDLGADHSLPVIDGWEMFINNPNPLTTLLADGVHPNDAGYRLFADALVKRIEDDLTEEGKKKGLRP